MINGDRVMVLLLGTGTVVESSNGTTLVRMDATQRVLPWPTESLSKLS